jgi:hypothetical protein
LGGFQFGIILSRARASTSAVEVLLSAVVIVKMKANYYCSALEVRIRSQQVTNESVLVHVKSYPELHLGPL